MGLTVEQDRSHLAEQVEYVGERGRFADETRSKSSTRQAGRNHGLHMGYTFLDKEKSFKSTRTSNQSYWDQKLAAVETAGVCRWSERIVGG